MKDIPEFNTLIISALHTRENDQITEVQLLHASNSLANVAVFRDSSEGSLEHWVFKRSLKSFHDTCKDLGISDANIEKILLGVL